MSRYTQAWLLLLFVWLGITTELRAQTVEYIHTDALGSPVAVTNAAGVVIERTEYAPYGEQLNRAEDDGPGYTGHVADKTTGLNYMQQRYYDPFLQRFISIDPVAVNTTTGANFGRYVYANNNPYRFTDPDGRQAMGSPNDFAHPVTLEQSRALTPLIADFTPVVGDIKGVVEAVMDPSLANIAAAGVGFVPIVGDGAAKIIKTSGKISGRVGDFTRAQKNAAKAESAVANGGKMACADCGKGVQSVKSEKGVPTPSNQAQVHHDPAIQDGGGQHSKPVVLCPECHNKRHNP